jgi:hypothetical protein
MGWLLRLWWGQYSLPAAFWGFYLAGGLGVFVLATVLAMPLLLFDARPLALLLFVPLTWGYWFTASVGVWRSASAGKSHVIYEMLAKLVVLLMVARFIWFAANGGLQRLMMAI